MRQQRVMMSQFDRNALLQYHQQAITHALAPQQAQKQMPAQLVFPDDTMAIGSPAVSRGALFPSEADGSTETEEERQRRLLQNEPIVVYTSLSDQRVLMPEIVHRGVALLVVIVVQVISITFVLAGGIGDNFEDVPAPTPSASQAGLYVAQLALHAFFLLSMYLWNADLLMCYAVLVSLVFILIVTLAVRSFLDVLVCLLCIPAVLLANSIKDLMMAHCFTVRAGGLAV